jgi:ankyrin repeat protein
MSDALPLPPRPNEEQYKILAKDLQDACKSSDPDAICRWAARWLETLVRLYGPFNWPMARGREPEAKQIECRWNKLKQTTNHLSKCTLAGAQFFIAREHGFANWPKFARHIQELARTNSPVSAFEAAADTIVNGDLPALRHLLARHPGLIRERSTREHHSTLLHYVSANGIEDFRQKTPPNIAEITDLLLDAGAEVDAESDAYSGGCTTLGLVATSAHPEKAGVQIALLRTLLDRGAKLQHPSAGGKKHSIVHGCLANGRSAAARFLADLGAPLDLESAAALGRLDVLRSYFDDSRAPRPETDRQKIESALLYACGYGSLETARFLLDRGTNAVAHDDQGQTTLHWAAWTPQVDVIRLLLERGAPVEAKDYRFHATPLDTALWTWANASEDKNRERCYEVIAVLARAGAKLDRDQWREAGKDNSPMLGRIDSDSRMLAALRGEKP